MGRTYIVLNGENKRKYEDVHEKKYDLVLGQLAAAGESIDGLQHRSHIVVYYAMPESSIEYIQSLGRIDRYGQTLVPMYYYLANVVVILWDYGCHWDDAVFDASGLCIDTANVRSPCEFLHQ